MPDCSGSIIKSDILADLLSQACSPHKKEGAGTICIMPALESRPERQAASSESSCPQTPHPASHSALSATTRRHLRESTWLPQSPASTFHRSPSHKSPWSRVADIHLHSNAFPTEDARASAYEVENLNCPSLWSAIDMLSPDYTSRRLYIS